MTNEEQIEWRNFNFFTIMGKKVIIYITMSEFRKKANSLNMTEEQFIDTYLNKVINPDLINGKEGVLNWARQIFHPTDEELKIDLEYSKELFSKYGIKDFQNHLSNVSPFKEFLELSYPRLNLSEVSEVSEDNIKDDQDIIFYGISSTNKEENVGSINNIE